MDDARAEVETDDLGRPIVGYTAVYREGERKNLGYKTLTHRMHDLGLHSRIDSIDVVKGRVSSVYRRLSRLNERVRISSDPRLAKMLGLAIRVLRVFTNDSGVDETVGLVLRKMLSSSRKRMGVVEYVAAAVYMSLRMHGYPEPLQKVVEAVCGFEVCHDLRRVFKDVWRLLRVVQMDLGMRYDYRRVVVNALNRLCGDDLESLRIALDMLQRIGVIGTKPEHLAAALCVVASAITGSYGYRTTCVELSRRLGTYEDKVRIVTNHFLDQYEVVVWLG